MTHQEIVNKVKSILNEHGEVDAVSIGEDRVLLEDYINEAIPDAVIMLAQKGYRVNVAKSTLISSKSCVAPGFLSLVSVKSPTWNKIVTTLTEVGSPEYIMAMNEFTAPQKNTPICYRTIEPILQGVTLHFMPDVVSDQTEVIFNTKYDGETLNTEPKEATAVCYMTAALVLGMFGDDQGKQRLSDISTNMLQ